jgi:hypothetical protein
MKSMAIIFAYIFFGLASQMMLLHSVKSHKIEPEVPAFFHEKKALPDGTPVSATIGQVCRFTHIQQTDDLH